MHNEILVNQGNQSCLAGLRHLRRPSLKEPDSMASEQEDNRAQEGQDGEEQQQHADGDQPPPRKKDKVQCLGSDSYARPPEGVTGDAGRCPLQLLPPPPPPDLPLRAPPFFAACSTESPSRGTTMASTTGRLSLSRRMTTRQACWRRAPSPPCSPNTEVGSRCSPLHAEHSRRAASAWHVHGLRERSNGGVMLRLPSRLQRSTYARCGQP